VSPQDQARPPIVFISYSHDSAAHKEAVLELSERLRAGGLDARIDQYIQTEGPSEGWPRWMDEQLRNADFVLLICTATYRRRLEGREEPGIGHGVLWEGSLVYQYIYNAATRNTRFLPVLLTGACSDDIPIPLQSVPCYRPLDSAGYEELYRRLTGQPLVRMGELGNKRSLPVQVVQPKPLATISGSGADGKKMPVSTKRPMGMVGAALMGVTGLVGLLVWLVSDSGQAPAGMDFRLKLKVRVNGDLGPGNKAPQMKLAHRQPKDMGINLLEVGTLMGDHEFEYESPVVMPSRGEKYLGLLHRLVTGEGSYQDPGFNEVCFERNADTLKRDPIVRIACQEGGTCQVARDDFGWAKPCSTGKPQSSWFRIPPVYAQSAQAHQEKGWVVPSLETLRNQELQGQGRAFTEFVLTSGALPELKDANRVVYEIRVNGELVYIDGLPPEANSVPFQAGTGVRLAFALENLDFSGKQAGYEEIDVVLGFHAGARTLQQKRVQLRYIALRSMPESQAIADPSLSVQWTASYHPGRRDDVYQIFILATDRASPAENLKSRIDAAQLRAQIGSDAFPLVGVVRPPNTERKNSTYGVALGLRQPSGQVKFSFDDSTSRQLCRSATRIAAFGSPLISSAFRRNISDRRDSRACAQF
jgi:hypothetical protein